MVGGSSFIVGFEGDEPWSILVKESWARRSLRFVRRTFLASRTRRPRAKLAELEVYPDYRKNALDNADDVIQGYLLIEGAGSDKTSSVSCRLEEENSSPPQRGGTPAGTYGPGGDRHLGKHNNRKPHTCR